MQEAYDGRNNLAEEHERQTELLQAAFERLYKCAIKTRPPPSRPVNVGSESGWIAYYADNRQWFECVPDGLFDNKFFARFYHMRLGGSCLTTVFGNIAVGGHESFIDGRAMERQLDCCDVCI